MTASVLAIAAALVGLLTFLIRRRVDREDSPAEQQVHRHEEIERQIVEDDERAANETLQADLARLRVDVERDLDLLHGVPGAESRSISRDQRGSAGAAAEGRD